MKIRFIKAIIIDKDAKTIASLMQFGLENHLIISIVKYLNFIGLIE